jgi:hypothetical protein
MVVQAMGNLETLGVVVEAQREMYLALVFSDLVVNINQLPQLFFRVMDLFPNQLILLAQEAEAQLLSLVLTAAAAAVKVLAGFPEVAVALVVTMVAMAL